MLRFTQHIKKTDGDGAAGPFFTGSGGARGIIKPFQTRHPDNFRERDHLPLVMGGIDFVLLINVVREAKRTHPFCSPPRRGLLVVQLK